MNLPIKKKTAIQTERLILKPYSQSDMPGLMNLISNKEIAKTFMMPDFENENQITLLAQTLITYSQLEDTTHLEYGIYLKDKLIGFINDCGIEYNAIEIGYVIHPDYQGYGYASEAVQAVLKELQAMGFQKVKAGFFAENIASRRVMEKCGMHQIDYMDEEKYRGTIHQCFYYEVEF